MEFNVAAGICHPFAMIEDTTSIVCTVSVGGISWLGNDYQTSEHQESLTVMKYSLKHYFGDTNLLTLIW